MQRLPAMEDVWLTSLPSFFGFLRLSLRLWREVWTREEEREGREKKKEDGGV